ncbi:MAG: hypothetical protein KBD01_09785 [Acidobacteria bacterium]|nr:hypothetical protein [Acidobacteriota bacterium]
MSATAAIQSAMFGLRAALQQLDRTAELVARSTDPGTLHERMVDLREVRHAVRANVEVVRAADETLGTLLDRLA